MQALLWPAIVLITAPKKMKKWARWFWGEGIPSCVSTSTYHRVMYHGIYHGDFGIQRLSPFARALQDVLCSGLDHATKSVVGKPGGAYVGQRTRTRNLRFARRNKVKCQNIEHKR